MDQLAPVILTRKQRRRFTPEFKRQVLEACDVPGDAYIERFNRTVRHEWLDMHSFESIEHAQNLATNWLWIYNNERPDMAIDGVPPRYLLKAA